MARIDRKQLEEFLENLKSINVDKRVNHKVFRISNSYKIKSLFFQVLILIAIFARIYRMRIEEKVNIPLFVVSALFLIYVIYSLIYIFSYKYVIEQNVLKINKKEINLKNIQYLILGFERVSFSRYEKCLKIISNNNEYIVRLNIKNELEFVKLVSKISEVNVGIE